MKNALTIASKEVKSYFVSPIAYVVLMIFLVLTGYFFYGNVIEFQKRYQYFQAMAQVYKNPEILEQLNVNSVIIANLLFNIIFILLFLMPLIMMRTFAEEKKNGTEELLMTSPVTVNEIIAGKFLGSLAFISALLVPTVIYQILLFTFAKPELGPVLSGYLCIFLFASVAISVGMFASSLTQNQIIAGVITFVILLMLFVIGMIDQGDDSALSKLVRYLSVGDHVQNLFKGLIEVKDIVYFVSLTTLFMFFTKQSVESVRWR